MLPEPLMKQGPKPGRGCPFLMIRVAATAAATFAVLFFLIS